MLCRAIGTAAIDHDDFSALPAKFLQAFEHLNDAVGFVEYRDDDG